MGHAKRKPDAETEEARARLREWCPPGTTVLCALDGPVARSGMSRTINLYANVAGSTDGPQFLSGYAARVLGENRRKNKDGITVGGCGMDMGFSLVSRLSYALYPDGFGCIGEGCPSNDHSNGDRSYRPHVQPCECQPCAVCQGRRTICGQCHMCTRCHDHAAGCKGCPGTPGAHDSAAETCNGCKGTGKGWHKAFGSDETEPCRTCDGAGTLTLAHWHRSGGYALRHRWL